MQMLRSLLALVFLCGLIAALLTFGFILFIWLTLAALVWYAAFTIRSWWWRKKGQESSSQSLKIIDVEYKDISDQ